MQNRHKGFTIVELMIAIAIVGILAAVAVPQYGNYMTESRRTDAHIELRAAAQELERCRTRNFSYINTACAFTKRVSGQGHYEIELEAGATATAFSLKATPKAGGAQASDSKCAAMTINQLGTPGSTDSDGTGTTDCW